MNKSTTPPQTFDINTVNITKALGTPVPSYSAAANQDVNINNPEQITNTHRRLLASGLDEAKDALTVVQRSHLRPLDKITLIRSCIVTKLTHLARSSLPDSILPLLRTFDEAVEQTISNIFPGFNPHVASHVLQLHLPSSLGGWGIPSLVKLADISFVAGYVAACSACPRIRQLDAANPAATTDLCRVASRVASVLPDLDSLLVSSSSDQKRVHTARNRPPANVPLALAPRPPAGAPLAPAPPAPPLPPGLSWAQKLSHHKVKTPLLQQRLTLALHQLSHKSWIDSLRDEYKQHHDPSEGIRATSAAMAPSNHLNSIPGLHNPSVSLSQSGFAFFASTRTASAALPCGACNMTVAGEGGAPRANSFTDFPKTAEQRVAFTSAHHSRRNFNHPILCEESHPHHRAGAFYSKHTAVAVALQICANKARLPAMREQAIPGSRAPDSEEPLRPDLIIQTTNSKVYVDVSIVNPYAPSNLRTHGDALSSGDFSTYLNKLVSSREDEKKSKYAAACANVGASFFPFVLTTDGVMGGQALSLLQLIAKESPVHDPWTSPFKFTPNPVTSMLISTVTALYNGVGNVIEVHGKERYAL